MTLKIEISTLQKTSGSQKEDQRLMMLRTLHFSRLLANFYDSTSEQKSRDF
jgi:hypothetical protein